MDQVGTGLDCNAHTSSSAPKLSRDFGCARFAFDLSFDARVMGVSAVDGSVLSRSRSRSLARWAGRDADFLKTTLSDMEGGRDVTRCDNVRVEEIVFPTVSNA